jgi:uncharacterized integral membrane protein (TIGR00698 family)
MNFIKDTYKGILLSLIIAIPSYYLGKIYSVIGGPIIGILSAMIITLFIKDKGEYQKGIKFVSKKILQWAVILLGFGLNLNVILETGKQSLPIILGTISTSLIIAFVLTKIMKIDGDTATLIGIGSSICGGSAIAAAAPVIDADEETIAQSIAVIFFFNVIAALLFPRLGMLLHFDTLSGNAFGIFAGTAINDTSSVTAAASTWDSIYNLGHATLDKAVTVKLTRTLAIIPITIVLALYKGKSRREESENIKWTKVFPIFIIYFVIASIITTLLVNNGVDIAIFSPIKSLSKFFIVFAMCAIGLNTNIVELVRKGGKPIFLGLSCWIGITIVSLTLQSILGIW